MPTEPWGRIRWVGLDPARRASERRDSSRRPDAAASHPTHGLITIRLADQPVPMTEPAEAEAYPAPHGG